MPRGTDQALSILPPSLSSPSSSSYIHPSFPPWFPPHRHHLYFPPVSHTSTQAVLVQQPSWKSLCDLARKFTRFLRVFDLSSSGNVAGADVEVDVGVVQNFKVQQPDYYDFNSASWFCKKFPSPRLFLWFCHGTNQTWIRRLCPTLLHLFP